jgi:hypothetical protein
MIPIALFCTLYLSAAQLSYKEEAAASSFLDPEA